MRSIIAAQYMSLDGVVEAPETWHFPYTSPEMFGILAQVGERIDTMLLGRVTYEVFAASFATAPEDNPVAAQLNRPAKVVVSSTLQHPAWARTTVIDGDVVAAVTGLKSQPGADILVNGSITLTRSLLRAGLVDEIHLFHDPVVVGTGRRLFETEGPRIPLTVDSRTELPHGVTYITYRPAA